MNEDTRVETMIEGCLESALDHPGHGFMVYTRSPAKYMDFVDNAVRKLLSEDKVDLLVCYRPDGIRFSIGEFGDEDPRFY